MVSVDRRVADRAKRFRELTASLGEGDRLLLRLMGGTSPTLTGGNRNALLSRARHHRVAPWLHRRLAESDTAVPVALRDSLRRDFLESSAANAILFHQLAPVLADLGRAGIPVIVLKGVHLAAAVYDSIALRPMGDVDLLVRRKDLGRAQRRLLAAGLTPQRGRVPIDIHWGLHLAHRDLGLEMEGVWRRAVPVTVAGVDVLGLSSEDLVVSVATHLSYQHLFEWAGLRGLVDLHEICTKEGGRIDWEVIAERAAAWRNPGGVYLALYLAAALLGTGVPRPALASLRPANFDDSLVEWAMGQIFSRNPFAEEKALSPYFWLLWGGGPIRFKLAGLRLLLAPSKEFISQKYPVEVESRRRFFFYLKRLGNHAGNYLRVLWKIVRRDPSVLARAERANRNLDMRGKLLPP